MPSDLSLGGTPPFRKGGPSHGNGEGENHVGRWYQRKRVKGSKVKREFVHKECRLMGKKAELAPPSSNHQGPNVRTGDQKKNEFRGAGERPLTMGEHKGQK